MEFELLGAGAAALTLSTDAAHAVASVSRSGTGVYVVTLKDAFTKVVFKDAEMDDTLNDGAYATVSDVTGEGTASPITFTIRTRAAAGTATEAASARRIGVRLALRNGSRGET
jgi:hypothetical protein